MKAAWALLLVVPAASAQGFCPSFTPSSATNPGRCSTEAVRGTNPTIDEWQPLFSLAASGPAAWTNGPSVRDLRKGCNRPSAPVDVGATFPCELIKAIAMQESGWKQFCVPTQPADQVGKPAQTIISFDCGYGVGQVTSGMRASDATPGYDRARVASEPFYSLATGLQILADKWRIVNCVGDRQPATLEHWYSAVWAYNGLSSVNSPNYPNYSSTRGVWNPSVGGSAPYQEKVFGRLQYPPSAAHWTSTALAYPRLSEVGASSAPLALPDPSCASPTSCTQARALHETNCASASADGGVDAGPPEDAGTDDDAGSHEPDAGAPVTLLSRAPDALGEPARGCGCASSALAWPALWLCALALAARRVR